MSRRETLEGFLGYLLRRPPVRADAGFQRSQVRKLQRAIERVEQLAVMRPARNIESAVRSLQREKNQWSVGTVWRVWRNPGPTGGAGFRRMLTNSREKWDDEDKRIYLAVCIARHLWPGKSAYAEVQRRLKANGDHREVEALRQKVRRERALAERMGERSVWDFTIKKYCEFRNMERVKGGRLPADLVMTLAETNLLQKVLGVTVVHNLPQRRRIKSHG